MQIAVVCATWLSYGLLLCRPWSGNENEWYSVSYCPQFTTKVPRVCWLTRGPIKYAVTKKVYESSLYWSYYVLLSSETNSWVLYSNKGETRERSEYNLYFLKALFIPPPLSGCYIKYHLLSIIIIMGSHIVVATVSSSPLRHRCLGLTVRQRKNL